MTCTAISSPTRRAAAAPASVDAFYGADVAADEHGDVAGADVFLADEDDVRGLDHRVSGLDRTNQSPRFDHPKCVHWSPSRAAAGGNGRRGCLAEYANILLYQPQLLYYPRLASL